MCDIFYLLPRYIIFLDKGLFIKRYLTLIMVQCYFQLQDYKFKVADNKVTLLNLYEKGS